MSTPLVPRPRRCTGAGMPASWLAWPAWKRRSRLSAQRSWNGPAGSTCSRGGARGAVGSGGGLRRAARSALLAPAAAAGCQRAQVRPC